jgi:hypothetical protein
MQRLVEIRAYQLKPGAAAEFHAAVETIALPMLRDWGTDVVAYGPSGHAPDSYYLIRAYTDLDDLNRQQDAFYGSDEWRSARARRSCPASRLPQHRPLDVARGDRGSAPP